MRPNSRHNASANGKSRQDSAHSPSLCQQTTNNSAPYHEYAVFSPSICLSSGLRNAVVGHRQHFQGKEWCREWQGYRNQGEMAAANSSPYSSYRPALTRPNGAKNQRRQHHPEHENWRSYASIDIYIPSLPPNTTTLDIHRSFQSYGEVTLIKINETRQGRWSRQAFVTFK